MQLQREASEIRKNILLYYLSVQERGLLSARDRTPRNALKFNFKAVMYYKLQP